MPTARLNGQIACPVCDEVTLRYMGSNHLACTMCGRVYAAPTVELLEIGELVPKPGTIAYLSDGQEPPEPSVRLK